MRNRMNNLLIGTSIVAAVGAGGVIADRALAFSFGPFCCKACISIQDVTDIEVSLSCIVEHCEANGQRCGGDCENGSARAECVDD